MACYDVASNIRPTLSAGAERTTVVTGLQDDAVFDIYVATHTDEDLNVSGGGSPGGATTAMAAAVAIPDVTPPTFAAGTPFPTSAGINFFNIAIASSETATFHAMVLRATAQPPDSSAAVVAGLAPNGTAAVGTGTAAASVGVLQAVKITGDMFPGREGIENEHSTDVVFPPTSSV